MSESIEAQLARIINNYSDEIVQIMDDEAQKTSEETLKIVESKSPKRTGKYSKSFKIKRESRLKGSSYIIHSPKHYRRTHLLEKGHIIVVNGKTYGRTRAFPHFAPAEEHAKKVYPDRVSKRIEGL